MYGRVLFSLALVLSALLYGLMGLKLESRPGWCGVLTFLAVIYALYWTAHALRFSDYEFKSHTLQGWGEDWPICYSDLARYYTQAEQLMGVCGSVERLEAQPDGQFLPPFAFRRGESCKDSPLYHLYTHARLL